MTSRRAISTIFPNGHIQNEISYNNRALKPYLSWVYGTKTLLVNMKYNVKTS